MALTTTEENQLRELLRHVNATQSGKTVDQLTRVETGGGVTDVVIRKTGGGLARASQDALIDSLLDNGVRSNGVRRTTADQTVNHLMTRDATRSEISRITAAGIAEAKGIGQAARDSANAAHGTANSAKSTADGLVPRVNANTEALKGCIKGYTNGLTMDFGSIPTGTGASTITFNRRFKGVPIVIVNFWGDIGNPRFSLAQNGNETWGIRLSATYPGVWAAIGEPV